MKNTKKTVTKAKASKQLKLKTKIKAGYYLSITLGAGAEQN